jgi:hypothetical protein
VGAFPNDGALIRLDVSILMDINEESVTGRKYLIYERGVNGCGYGPEILQKTRHTTRYFQPLD